MTDPTIISNIFKIKYEKMNEYFEIYFKNIKPRKKILILMDIGKIINVLMIIAKKNSMIVTKKQKQKILISVLNIIAHYRHYFYSVHKCTNSFVLYCSNIDHYDEYDDIIEEITNITKFIPGIIAIPRIETENKFYYIHLVAHIIEYVKKLTNSMSRELVVFCTENNPLEYQYLMIEPNTFYCRTSAINDIILDYKKIWEKNGFNNKECLLSLKNSLGLRNLLIPYLISFKRVPELNDNLYKSIKPNFTIKEREEFILNVLERSKFDSNNIVDIYLNYLPINDESKLEFTNILKSILYISNTQIKPFIKELIKSWNQKLTDKKIMNINEFSEVLNIYNINIMWLQENKGV